MDECIEIPTEIGDARETLYGLITSLFGDVDDGLMDKLINSYLDQEIEQDPALSALAETAGGRWHVAGSELRFVTL